MVGSGKCTSGQGGLQHFKRKKATDGRKDKIMDLTVSLNVNGEFLECEEQLLTGTKDTSVLTITLSR